MTKRISLSVNDVPIEMDYFVQRFVDHKVGGVVSSLEGVAEMRDIEVRINGNRVYGKARYRFEPIYLPVNQENNGIKKRQRRKSHG